MKRRLFWVIWIVVVLVAAAMGEPAEEGKPAGDSAAKNPAKPRPLVTISKETTFITGPLRKDGTVDYVAAIDQRYSQGVTPENNAVVLLLQAFGPAEIFEPIRPAFFKKLGVPPPPEKGPYLEPFRAYFERKSPSAEAPKDGQKPDGREKAVKELERIMDRPWSKKDSPIGAAWLEENQKQIDLVVAASKRPRFYAPFVSGRDEPGGVIALLLPEAQQSREAARDLRVRAVFRVGAGKPEEAWQDLLACHRLARLVDQGPTLVEELVAIAIEGIAIQGDAVLAHEGKLTAEQARRFAAEFRKLPPMSKMVDKINWAERLMYLDCVLAMATSKRAGELATLMDAAPDIPKGKIPSCVLRLLTALADWNEPMRMGNRWHDRLAGALSKPTRKERDAAVAEFERDLKKLGAEAKDPRALLRNIAFAGSLGRGLGRQMGHVFIALFMPALSACMNAEDRNTTSEGIVPLVFALAAYRADHGGYPPDLAALVPKYLPAIPEDLFSGGPFRYKREGAGYVLYSVGPNGKDDGGRNSRDEPNSEANRDFDDVAIRVPARESKT